MLALLKLKLFGDLNSRSTCDSQFVLRPLLGMSLCECVSVPPRILEVAGSFFCVACFCVHFGGLVHFPGVRSRSCSSRDDVVITGKAEIWR
jgi:hypothetical protein